jgi:hypothetical protein
LRSSSRALYTANPFFESDGMNLVDLIFGKRPTPASTPTLTAPPADVSWREARPKPDATPVHAWRAEADHNVHTRQGVLKARGGRDVIIDYGKGDHAVVRADIFEQTYEPAGAGLYRKRDDIKFRFFTLTERALVQTLEGVQEAAPGDWIMQGVIGELWPVPHSKALEKYELA